MASRDPRIDTLIDGLVADLVSILRVNVQRVFSEVSKRGGSAARVSRTRTDAKPSLKTRNKASGKRAATPRRTPTQAALPLATVTEQGSASGSGVTRKGKNAKLQVGTANAKRSAQQLSLF
jgi:hypothetical protein